MCKGVKKLKSYNDKTSFNGYKIDCLIKNEYCVIHRSSAKVNGKVSGQYKQGILKTGYYELI